MSSCVVARVWLPCFIACIVIFHNTPAVNAQIAVTQDFFPYQNLTDPGPGQNNAQIQSRATSLSVGFPLIYAEGRTVVINQLFYRRRDFSYKGFTGAPPTINDIHELNYTFTLRHGFSERWSLLAIVTPGLASDFEASLSIDDFNFQAITAFFRQYGPRFTLGFGAVYSTQFGQPIPLPALSFNWNISERLRWDTILPVSSELWYNATSKLDLGILFGLDGNNYRGDPSLFGVSDPQLRYFVLTLGPSVNYNPTGLFGVKIDSGFIGVHQFKLFNGNTEQAAFDLKRSPFVRVGISVGGR